MGKQIAVVATILVTFVSVIVFLTQPDSAQLSKELAAAGEPRIIIDEISMMRFRDNTPVGAFRSKLAHFVDPNIVEAFASVYGMRLRNKVQEEMHCEAAHAQFDAENMGALMHKDDTRVLYAEVEDQVVLSVKKDEIRTERAQYHADRDLVSSREPVNIEGPNRMFVGEEGFNYNLRSEVMELPGQVRGVIKASAFEKTQISN